MRRLSIPILSRLVQDRLRYRGIWLHNALVRVIVRMVIDAMHDQFPRILEEFLRTHQRSEWWLNDSDLSRALARRYSRLRAPERRRTLAHGHRCPIWLAIHKILSEAESMRLSEIADAVAEQTGREYIRRRDLTVMCYNALRSKPTLFMRVTPGVWSIIPDSHDEFERILQCVRLPTGWQEGLMDEHQGGDEGVGILPRDGLEAPGDVGPG